MTNDSYFLEHNRIVLSAKNKAVAHLAVRWNPSFFHPNSMFRSDSFSAGYVGKYKCAVVGLCLLVCLW